MIARIGTLFFITIPGEVEREGQLEDFYTVPDKTWFQNGPITFEALFENTGSIHLAPYGTLSITNSFGDEVGYVELDPWFVMPESVRSREIIWEQERLIGRYTATLNVNRSYDNSVDTKTVTFWVIPWQLLLGTFLGVLIVILTSPIDALQETVVVRASQSLQ